ncbi:hypothetical protein LINGRAHAP2_LOCUS18612 [Linum grandiflorum]
MAGIRLPPEESEISQQQIRAATAVAGDLISDDERSVAADSWSIKSDYGSTLDDEQRHADATDALCAANFRAASDYRYIPPDSIFVSYVFLIELCIDKCYAAGKWENSQSL